MHRRDQAWQAWIIPGVVNQVANNRSKERRGEDHAIVRLFQLRRQIDRQRLRTQSIQRFRIGIGEVRERRSAARGVNRASPKKGLAPSLVNGQAGRNRIGRINGVKDKSSPRLSLCPRRAVRQARKTQFRQVRDLIDLAARRLEQDRGADPPVDIAQCALSVRVERPRMARLACDVSEDRRIEPGLTELTEHDCPEIGIVE